MLTKGKQLVNELRGARPLTGVTQAPGGTSGTGEASKIRGAEVARLSSREAKLRVIGVLTRCKVLHTLANDRFSGKGTSVKEQTTVSADTAIAPVLLTPALVEKMLASREAVQVMKFRTTCTDCLPNY